MKIRRFVLQCALVSLGSIGFSMERIGLKSSRTPVATQNAALKGLLTRVVGNSSSLFEITVDRSLKDTFKGRDGFRIKVNSSQIVITGTAGYAAANGLNFYIRKTLGGQFSWSGKRIPLPPVTAVSSETLDVPLADKLRYYGNVCTASYSFVWWQWPRWQREIDWMAMNGINFPLASTGQEIVLTEVFKVFGVNETEVETFLSGPAFLAWNRLGNLRRFGGRLPLSWRHQQKILQKMILKRMTDFEMTPVLPGFNGFLPRAFEQLYPHVQFRRASRWNHLPDEFACPTLITPTEDFFYNISSLYVRTYRSVYGSGHVYNVDLFNELTPTTTSLEDLATISSNVYRSLSVAEPSAIWVMQGWMFGNNERFWTPSRVEAFITSPPIGKLIILDLFSEQSPQFSRLSNYFGVPFVWCMLHNYGGVNGLFGNFDWINGTPLQARANVANMIGIGITPEGTGQNEVIYEFMAENSYRQKPENVHLWLLSYAKNRYGLQSKHLQSAWQLLHRSVYNVSDMSLQNHGRYILTHRPKLDAKPLIWYNPSDVSTAVLKFILASSSDPSLCNETFFQQDFVDVTRQALQVRVSREYMQMMFHFKASNVREFERHSRRLLRCIDILDEVLSTNEQFLLGSWIHAARQSAGPDRNLKDRFEFNARNQITRWGPNGEITDYASKMWAGVVKDYYGKRWQVFVRLLTDALRTRTHVDEKLLETSIIQDAEIPFTESRREYPSSTTGNICKLRHIIGGYI